MGNRGIAEQGVTVRKINWNRFRSPSVLGVLWLLIAILAVNLLVACVPELMMLFHK